MTSSTGEQTDVPSLSLWQRVLLYGRGIWSSKEAGLGEPEGAMGSILGGRVGFCPHICVTIVSDRFFLWRMEKQKKMI